MSLAQKIKDIIAEKGPITVAEYMSLALYDPQHGYYRKTKPIGAGGDFITSPEISQIFGELIGIWLAVEWETMESPEAIVVELGPGRGTLMNDILRATRNVQGFHEKIEVHLVEVSEVLRREQQKILSDKNVKIFWHETIDDLPDKPMLLVANEFFDALPIRQFRKYNNSWHEIMVALDNKGNLHFKNSEIFDKPEGDVFPANIKDNVIFEYSKSSIQILRKIAEKILKNKGAGLIIDYGYSGETFGDSLQSMKKHQFQSPLDKPGEADITAHVNFGHLRKAAHEGGAIAYGEISQGDFLVNMGIELRSAMLMKKCDEKMQSEIKSSVKRLISPEEMGTLFRCLAITDGDMPKPYGF